MVRIGIFNNSDSLKKRWFENESDFTEYFYFNLLRSSDLGGENGRYRRPQHYNEWNIILMYYRDPKTKIGKIYGELIIERNIEQSDFEDNEIGEFETIFLVKKAYRYNPPINCTLHQIQAPQQGPREIENPEYQQIRNLTTITEIFPDDPEIRKEYYVQKHEIEITEQVKLENKEMEKYYDRKYGEVRDIIIRSRIGQGKFRQLLFTLYDGCVICGLREKRILIGSHIKPWSKSEPKERIDKFNGLLLCATHDRLFDEGLITFSDEGQIIISKELDLYNLDLLHIPQKLNISLAEEMKKYLHYHRNHEFEKFIQD
jgi:hypothetical protein